ncbi:MAG TPA: amidohydrolase family protein [Acidimicrobiales bacterium]|jgi:N-acyl-D-aspartate/D-glutamate deacylase
MHDLVVRNGRIVDGTGAPAFTGDVAVTGGRITEVGAVDGPARRTIDADGRLVTPGVVDIHTHYDGQAMWDRDLTPSCWHGVTTVVMGNCSVGFAPCAPERRDWLIEMMESVEDIPASALRAGLDWSWETFPEYLDALDRDGHVTDVGTQIPHAAVRAYVMGERGARNEAAGPADIRAMAAIVADALRAGALGFSTSRTTLHHTADGQPIAGTFAARDELFGIGEVLRDLGMGLFEVVPAGVAGEDLEGPERDLEWMGELAAHIGRPVCFLMTQNNGRPDGWRPLLDKARDVQAAGHQLVVQVSGRPSGLLFGLGTTYHPLDDRPTFAALSELAPAEQALRLADPAVRAAIVGEEQTYGDPYRAFLRTRWDRMFPFGDPIDYEPGFEESVAGRAAALGIDPAELVLEMMAADPGALFMAHINNYADGDAEALRAMLTHPATALGLADGGAHVAVICDASMPTTMLTHWVRDRCRGERLPLEFVVQRQTRDTARLYGLNDRGVISPGYLADLNVIDFDRLAVRRPELAWDLPGGARRLVQRADGYVATIKGGAVTVDYDELTGARPGRVIRGAQTASL